MGRGKAVSRKDFACAESCTSTWIEECCQKGVEGDDVCYHVGSAVLNDIDIEIVESIPLRERFPRYGRASVV